MNPEAGLLDPDIIDFGDGPAAVNKSELRLRGRQLEWLNTMDSDLNFYSRTLVVAPGGVGKTSMFAALAARMESRGKRTLILENRDKLTRQTAKRIIDETDIPAEIEMADEHASPFASIVVASVQTLGRVNRLTGFSDTHFDLIIPDEAHFSLAPQWQRVLRYFHYGAESLDENWTPPADGTYIPKARVVGFTATPDIGERKNLGEFYQHRSVNYSYLEAVNDGWLVGPVQKNIPVKVDLKKYKVQRTDHGSDFRAGDLEEAMIPIIEELAEQTLAHAFDRKTICFMPSVKCARLMVDALTRRGMQAWLAAGDEEMTEENTAAFTAAGRGSVLVNAQIYVYGVDFPDVDCIAWYRATISRAFYIQGLYRASRILLPKGVLESCRNAEERRAAIAASTKPNFLILDPLFVSDRIDLLDAYDLFTDKPEVKERMKKDGALTPEAAEKAERDFIKTLEKEAKKHARKAARTIDPLAIAVSLGDSSIRDYVPQPGWESAPPTQGQLDFIRRQGIAVEHIKYKGLASKIIGRLMNRLKHNLATAGQLSFMLQLGVEEQTAAKLSKAEAGALLEKMKAQKATEKISPSSPTAADQPGGAAP